MKFSWPGKYSLYFLLLLLAVQNPGFVIAATGPITVTVESNAREADLQPQFLGLSYETSMVLPKDGRYYFDAHDQALINVFKTLGIKSLRIGGNSVDDARFAVPQEKDIDALFGFARAAGVKIIYSFRLKHGDPSESARLAKYISDHYSDSLDSFAIGNESNFYLKTFEEFFAAWKPHYDAIRKAVPGANFDGPSADKAYALLLADAVAGDGHLAMASEHFYFLGFGRVLEKNPSASRDRFLSNKLHDSYERDYTRAASVLAARGVAYRIDEMNNCCDGGAKDVSDTYAATLWSLDCTHWWAAHQILGVNYHTGELVGRDGKFGPPNYAAFLRDHDGYGFNVRPQGYAYLAFSQGAHGRPLEVKIEPATNSNFSAYAYRDLDKSVYLTLINKSYANSAQSASVSLQLPRGVSVSQMKRMDLAQKNQDVAAKTDVTLGGEKVNLHGVWAGQWQEMASAGANNQNVQISPASATILHFFPSK